MTSAEAWKVKEWWNKATRGTFRKPNFSENFARWGQISPNFGWSRILWESVLLILTPDASLLLTATLICHIRINNNGGVALLADLLSIIFHLFGCEETLNSEDPLIVKLVYHEVFLAHFFPDLYNLNIRRGNPCKYFVCEGVHLT